MWRSRVLQVTAFIGAAGLRKVRSYSEPRPGSKSASWPSDRTISRGTTRLNPAALITYHPEYHAFEPEMALRSLCFAHQLSVGWVRSDLRWHYILPDGVRPDPLAIAWYREYLRTASRLGLKTMAVLSSPPERTRSLDSAKKLDAWTRFVEIVIAELSPWCDSYQLMNEPNNPVYRFASPQDSAEALVAGASTIHKASPSAGVAINISMDIWGWRHYLENILERSNGAVNIIGLDHYPGTWTIGQHERWADVIELAELIANAPTGSIWSNRRLAVLETGFSTNAILRDERRQADYFRQLHELTTKLKTQAGAKGFVLGIYELCDANSTAGLDPEAHFGLMTTDLRPKKAFSVAVDLVASF